VLTKPLGTGVIATAIKANLAPAGVAREAIETMATLNAAAADAAREVGVRGGTDVTGFGLLGHLHRMLAASGAAARVRWADVPLLSGASELAVNGHVPAGSKRNFADLHEHVTWVPEVPQPVRILMADAQTSGGLLLSVAPERAADLVARLRPCAPAAALIGDVVEGRAGAIEVR
jgi:selenide,water dikinase